MPSMQQISNWISQQTTIIQKNIDDSPSLSLKYSPSHKAILTLVISTVMLWGINFVASNPEVQYSVTKLWISYVGTTKFGKSLTPLIKYIFWACTCFLFYFLIPALTCRFLFRESLKNFGFSLKNLHLQLYLLLYFLLFWGLLACSYTDSFKTSYPMYRYPQKWVDLFIWEIFYLLQFVALEFFFRGFMLHGIKAKFGILSIFVCLAPYMMIHFHKPALEAFASIFAGFILGILSLRTNTIFGGILLHYLVALSMDILCLWQKGWLSYG